MPQIPDFDTEPTFGICTEGNSVIAIVYPDGHPEAVEPNARLIVAACNAAMNANPENPIAAAKALPDLLMHLRNILEEYAALDSDAYANSIGVSLALDAIDRAERR